MAVSPDGSTLYVARCASTGRDGCNQGAVDVIATSGFTLTTSIPLPQGTPQSIVFGSGGSVAYVTIGSAHHFELSGIAVIITGQNVVSTFLPCPQALLGSMAVLPASTTAFVADLTFPVVYRIDLTSGRILNTIRIKAPATGMALSPDASMLYVAGQSLTGIDTFSNAISFTSYITITTAGVAVSPDGTKCYVVDYYESTLDTFDLSEQIVTARVPTGFRPLSAVVTPDGSTSFVANSGSSTVSEIDGDTNTLIAQAEAGSQPVDVELSPQGAFLYATNSYSSNVSILSTKPFERLINLPTGYLPTASALSPDGTRLYVNTYNATITVIDTIAQTVIGVIPTAPDGSTSAYGLAVSRNSKRLYALTSYRDFSGILVIDTDTNHVLESIPVAGDLAEIAVGPLGDYAYISGDTDQPFLIAVDLVHGKQVGSIPAYKPYGVKLSPLGKYIFTGSSDRPLINVIDRLSGQTVKQIPVAGTVAIALNASGTRLYATGPVVTVIDTASMNVIATVDTGGLSFGVAAP